MLKGRAFKYRKHEYTDITETIGNYWDNDSGDKP